MARWEEEIVVGMHMQADLLCFSGEFFPVFLRNWEDESRWVTL